MTDLIPISANLDQTIVDIAKRRFEGINDFINCSSLMALSDAILNGTSPARIYVRMKAR